MPSAKPRMKFMTVSLSTRMLIMFHISVCWTLTMICGTVCADGCKCGGVRASFSARGFAAHQRGGQRSTAVVAGGAGAPSLRLVGLAHRGRQAQADELSGGAGAIGRARTDQSASAAPHGALWR